MSQISSHAMATAFQALAPSVLDSAPAFIGICDSKFKPIYLNSAGREMVHFPKHQLIDDTAIRDFFVPDQRRLIARVGLPTVAREGQWEQEVSFRDWSDATHELKVHYFAFGLYDHQKAFLAGVTITREIVTRKKAAAAVRDSQAMVNDLLGMLPLDIGVFDGTGKLLHSNDSWRQHGVVSLPVRAGQRARWSQQQESKGVSPQASGIRALAGQPVEPHPVLKVRENEPPKWIRISARPFKGIGKVEGGAAVIVEDIDELERTKMSLAHSDARLRLAADVSGLGTFSFDPVLGVFTCDERHRRLWGISSNETGDWQMFQDGIHPDDGRRVRAAIGTCFSAGQPKKMTLHYRVVGRDDRRTRHITSTLLSMFEGGQLRGLIGASVEASAEGRISERIS